jgi:hypothetical protein
MPAFWRGHAVRRGEDLRSRRSVKDSLRTDSAVWRSGKAVLRVTEPSLIRQGLPPALLLPRARPAATTCESRCRSCGVSVTGRCFGATRP